MLIIIPSVIFICNFYQICNDLLLFLSLFFQVIYILLVDLAQGGAGSDHGADHDHPHGVRQRRPAKDLVHEVH